jgi:hypothetical protein
MMWRKAGDEVVQENWEAGLLRVPNVNVKKPFRVGLQGFGWNPHGDYARELTFFVRYVGLDPLQVITCATKSGAEIMGREKEIGTLESGKLADVLVVDGNVLKDVSVLEDRSRFIAVMQGGMVKAGQLARPSV